MLLHEENGGTLVRSDSRQRVLSAIQHQPVEKIPKGELCIDDGVIKKELGCDIVGFEERLEFVERLGVDLVCLSPKNGSGEGIPEYREVIWEDIERWTRDTSLFSFALLDGPFGWGIRSLGFERFITLHARSPLNLVGLIERVEALNVKLSEILVEQGIDGIIIADDIAYNRGLLVSPRVLREYFLPSLERQVEAIAKRGIPVFFHSDGNYSEVIADLVEIGFKGVHCIDRNADMDVVALQQAYGKTLCLWGTLDVADLAKADDEMYLAELIDRIEGLGSRGGFILGTTSGLFEGIDIRGLMRVYHAVK
ncbi:MAG: uroporphyrinogen decarboxylase family protein [Thermacetogeniaceae bacterium]